MKILIVTETLYEGGAELFVLRLARGLIAKAENVQVLSLNRKCENKEMMAMFTDVPVQRISLPLISVIDFADRVFAKLRIDFSLKYFLLGRIIKRKYSTKYDIIHSNYIQADHCIASVNNKKSFRHIVTIHGDYSAIYDQYKKGELRYWLNLDRKLKKLQSCIDGWVIISEEQRSFLLRQMNISPERINKIYNGYALQEVVKPETGESGCFTIGMVSRGVKRKGWQLLIDAFLKLPENNRLILVGAGEYIQQLKEQYSSNSRIIFTGYQADPLQWIRQMDVFVLPTLFAFESLPTVIIEALYCGKPVIASKVGEIEAMLTDNDTGLKGGFVIDVSDEVKAEEELYRLLLFLNHHPEELTALAQTAKRCSDKFDMDRCVSSYRHLYNNIAGKT